MDICNATDLGSFSQCQPIEIEEIGEESVIRNIVTGWSCTPDPEDELFLAPGYYRFENGSTLYEFKVV